MQSGRAEGPGRPSTASGPLTLPDYGVAFIEDALTHRESFLCIGPKSAIVAAHLLARLVGPLRTAGYRSGGAIINKEKAASSRRRWRGHRLGVGLAGSRFLRSPAPGRVESAKGSVDILSADESAGHASGFDDAIIDELGLFAERDRALVNGMRSSTSAKDGRFIALSIHRMVVKASPDGFSCTCGLYRRLPDEDLERQRIEHVRWLPRRTTNTPIPIVGCSGGKRRQRLGKIIEYSELDHCSKPLRGTFLRDESATRPRRQEVRLPRMHRR